MVLRHDADEGLQDQGRYKLEARVEAYNAFNQIMWGQPNTTLSSSNFGKVTTKRTDSTGREIQIGSGCVLGVSSSLPPGRARTRPASFFRRDAMSHTRDSSPRTSGSAGSPLAPDRRLRRARSQRGHARRAGAPAVSVTNGPDGRLVYAADAAGNRVVDFSYAGYGGGGVALPSVPARIAVPSGAGRDRQRVQAALDLVAAMPATRALPRRGVAREGTFDIDTSLRIAAGGVVLRGAGPVRTGPCSSPRHVKARVHRAGGAGERREAAGSRRQIGMRTCPQAPCRSPLTVRAA